MKLRIEVEVARPLGLHLQFIEYYYYYYIFFFCYFFSFTIHIYLLIKPNQQQRHIVSTSGFKTRGWIKSAAVFSLSVHIAIRVNIPIIKDLDDGVKWLDLFQT